MSNETHQPEAQAREKLLSRFCFGAHEKTPKLDTTRFFDVPDKLPHRLIEPGTRRVVRDRMPGNLWVTFVRTGQSITAVFSVPSPYPLPQGEREHVTVIDWPVLRFAKTLWRIVRQVGQERGIPQKERRVLLVAVIDEVKDRLHGFAGLHAGSDFVNLVVRTADREPSWWGRVIFYVSDVDRLYDRAVASRLMAEMPPSNAEWGERYFHIRDPDGHELSFAQPLVAEE